VFWIQLGLPHPLIVSILRCVCTHPIDPMGIHFLRCVHGNKHTWTNDTACNTFATITWDVNFHVGQNNYMCFFQTCSTSLVDKLTLCSPKMAFAL
jgi:hypothetical protein